MKPRYVRSLDLRIGLNMICRSTGEKPVIVSIGDKIRVLYPASGYSRWWSKSHIKKYYTLAPEELRVEGGGHAK